MISKELVHYGVKGMKWGVRKKRYRSEYDSDTVLKKGSSVQNISPDSARKISDDRPIYGAITKRDKLNYRGWYADTIKNLEGKTPYNNTLTVTKDIKIASQRKAVETFREMFDQDPRAIMEATAKARAKMTVFGALSKSMNKLITSSYIRKFEKGGEEWLNTKGYEMFNQNFMSPEFKKYRKAYTERLMKKGYDGVIDVNDVNNYYKSEKPVIILTPKNNLRNEKSVKLTQSEIDAAIEELEGKPIEKIKGA